MTSSERARLQTTEEWLLEYETGIPVIPAAAKLTEEEIQVMASNGVNKVILIGNAGRDPEQRGSVVSLALATSESWKDKNTGEKQEKTEWHQVVFFDRLAEVVAQYVRKGSKIYIEGKLASSTWEQDGVKRYKTEIHALNMQMLNTPETSEKPQQRDPDQGRPSARYQDNGPPRQSSAQPERTPRNAPPTFDSFDDDIPF